MSTQPVTLKSATELLKLLRERKLGALELLDLQVSRIARLNPALNAVVALDVESARQRARAADNAPADKRGPLHGLSITIKDAFEVSGMPATCGFPHLAKHVPQSDADAVARLRDAGAAPFGKTNVPLAAADHQSYNAIYGTTNNPWDVKRTPGGSSGGAAAAVAAGFSRSSWEATLVAPSVVQRTSAESTVINRVTTWSRSGATFRRRLARYRGPRWGSQDRLPAALPTSNWRCKFSLLPPALLLPPGRSVSRQAAMSGSLISA